MDNNSNNDMEIFDDIKKSDYEKKKGIFTRIKDFISNTIFLISLIYLGLMVYNHFYPYEFNKYYELIVKRNDIEKTEINKNEYFQNDNYLFVQNMDYLYAKDRQDLLNILYTFVNSGEKNVYFYCSKEYKSCVQDAKDIIYKDNEHDIVSSLYEFIHPFNDYKSLSANGDKEINYVVYKAEKKYSKKKIKEINAVVDQVYDELVDPNDTQYNNIKRIHDYLVNTIEYDKVKSDYIDKKSDVDSEYDATSAYGALVQHKAVCGGYTDAMYLFLEKMGIQSMRITSATHIWNAVYLDGTWYHLDVTWDDARYTNGKTFLSHNYFLIDTPTLLELDTDSHTFDQTIYQELAVK